jgi:hypothetical protein
MPSLEILEATIVAVGSFNPPIVGVDWLESHGLIGSGDAEQARSRPDYIVSRQITRFQTDPVLVQIIENQLSIAATGPVSPGLCDLDAGIFDLLPHTPVTAVGINFSAHYKTEDLATYHRIGDKFAPKRIWDQLFQGKAVGLMDLTLLVHEGNRDDVVPPNQQRISLQPSQKVKQGIFLQLNDHHGTDLDGKLLTSADAASEVVRKFWAQTYTKSLELFKRILDMSIAEKTN